MHKLAFYRQVPIEVFPGLDGDGSGAPAPLTADQVQTMVNTAVSSAMTNFRSKDLPKLFEPLTTQLTGITEALAGLTSQQQSAAGAQGGQGSQAGAGTGAGAQGGQGAQGAQGNGVPPEINAQLKTLTDRVTAQDRNINNLQKERDDANKRAETAERNGVINTALGDLTFANPAAAKTAFGIIAPFVTKLDDGSFVGSVAGENPLPLADFVKDYIPRDHAYLLKQTGASGSGAGSPSSNGGGSGKVVDIGQIKPGMSADVRANILSAIQASMPATN